MSKSETLEIPRQYLLLSMHILTAHISDIFRSKFKNHKLSEYETFSMREYPFEP